MMRLLLSLLMLVGVVAATPPALAHEGHDHDKPPPLALPIAPRVTAVTPDYELVGVLSDNARLTLFLTSFATNEPVKDARIVVEADEHKVEAVAKGDGVFDVSAPWLAGEGGLDLVFNLTLPDGGDLLTGRLNRPAFAAPGSEAVAAGFGALRDRSGGMLLLLVGLGGAILGALATLLLSPRARSIVEHDLPESQPHAEANAVAAPATRSEDGIKLVRRAALGLALAVWLLVPGPPARAADAAVPSPATPTVPSTMATDLAQRLADGSLFVPKATQHLLSVRTKLRAESDATTAVELAGTVMAGPNSFGRVQAGHSGRLTAPEGGLGHVGKRVKAGDVLGYLEPHITPVERGAVASQVAEADARIAAQKLKLARLRGAPLAVPPIKVEEAEGELKALQGRRRELTPALSERFEIVAPISGVVSKAGYFAGQIIEPRDVLFEIVDPSEFWVEAIAYGNPDVATDAKASATGAANQRLELTYVGRGLALKEQAAPLMFKITGDTERVAIGQPVRVVLSSTKTVKGFVVPSSSIVRNQNGLPIVWVKTDAERFEPQPVKTEPLDGQNVVVTVGLKADVRIVTEGVMLLNQVR